MTRLRLARSVKLFWAVVGGVAALGIIALAILGPMSSPSAGNRPGLVKPAHGIPAPNPELLVASPFNAAWKIPHPTPEGMTPMHYYAGRAPRNGGDHRVAVMVGGIGNNMTTDMRAVTQLPAAVSLALTPYGAHIAALAASARKAGHETLMGLAMGTGREPAVTEGDKALREGALSKENAERLDWMLSRAAGYAGVTDEIGMAVNETYLTHDLDRQWLSHHLKADGLFLVPVSAATAVPAGLQGRQADIVIHPDMSAAQQHMALKRLAALAISHGSALGVISSPTKNDITTLASWCKGLAADGITLVPVSALAVTSAAS